MVSNTKQYLAAILKCQCTSAKFKASHGSDNEPWRRQNGYQLPFHPLQVVTWFVVPFFVAIFYGICLPNMTSPGEMIGLGVVNFLLGAVSVCFALAASRKDPIALKPGPQDDSRYCSICQHGVRPGVPPGGSEIL